MADVGTIECFRGEDFAQPFTVAAGGLTGATLYLRVYDSDGVTVIEYTTANNVTIDSDTQYTVQFDSADTDIAPGRYQFSTGFDPSGGHTPTTYGRFEVLSPPCI